MPFTPANRKHVLDGCLGIDLAEKVAGTGTGFDQGDQFTLGQIVKTRDGGEYMRCHAAAAISQFMFVAVDENYEAVPMTKALADAGHMLGVAQVGVADNDFFWLALSGSDIGCLVAASCLQDVPLFTTATAGVADDLATSQSRLEGVKIVTTVGGAQDSSECIIQGRIQSPIPG